MAQTESRERDSQRMRNIARNGANENSPLLLQAEETSTGDLETHVTNRMTWTKIKNMCKRRIFKPGKGLLLVLFIYLMESVALTIAIQGIQLLFYTFRNNDQDKLGPFLYILIFDTLGRLFYPLGGILADSYLGRYKVIEIGLWLFWVALAIVTFTLTIAQFLHPFISGIVIPVLCVLLIAVGLSSIEVNSITFGVDQLAQGCPSQHISSYFFWLYFVRNIASLAGDSVLYSLSFTELKLFMPKLKISLALVDERMKFQAAMMLAILLITVAICIHRLKDRWYFKNDQKQSPVSTVCRITWYSMTVKRHAPIRKRAFRYGEGRLSRFELAKYQYDGKFDAEEVENVKTFYQILLVIFSLGGYFASYSAAYSMLSSELSAFKFENRVNKHLESFVNSVSIVILLPLINHCILPFLDTSLKIRLFFGILFNLLALLSASFLQGTVEMDASKFTHDVEQLLWLVFPSILLAIGEMLTFVSSLEFINAQAPESLKGLLTGLFYFMFGMFGGIASITFYFVPTDSGDKLVDNWVKFGFYVVFLLAAAGGLCFYGIVAYCYRNRTRPADDEDILPRTIMAGNVFGN